MTAGPALSELAALSAILAALAIGVVSPGPSFVMVARTAVARSRRQALGAALGMGAGGTVFGTAALLGLQGLFHSVPVLYLAFKVLGGLYLCYLGALIFRSASRPLAIDATDAPRLGALASFWLGLSTQLSNPKTAIVYASVFAAFMPERISMPFAAALLALIFVIEGGWYSLVALLLSSSAPQRAYLSYKTWIDRIAGTVMFGLGAKLMTGAAS